MHSRKKRRGRSPISGISGISGIKGKKKKKLGLTESYTCLRKLENEVIMELTGGQISMGEAVNPIKVSISQFYGIEINDFVVTVARIALWIAENRMMKQTEDIAHMELDFLPLKTNAYIVEGNALRIDWNDVVPKEKFNDYMGNPLFVRVWSKE